MKKLKLMAVVVAGLFVLGGCGQLGAGVAARVGDHDIRTSDIDLLTKAQCVDANTVGQAQSVGTLEAQSVNALVDAALNDAFAKSKGATYDPAILRAAMKSYDEKLFGSLPSGDRKRTAELFEYFTKGQLKMLDVGRSLLGAGGKAASEQDALNAAYQARATFEKTQHVEVDPEYRPSKSGVAGGGDSSLSVPVSGFAKKSTSTRPDPAWVGTLPLAQKCG